MYLSRRWIRRWVWRFWLDKPTSCVPVGRERQLDFCEAIESAVVSQGSGVLNGRASRQWILDFGGGELELERRHCDGETHGERRLERWRHRLPTERLRDDSDGCDKCARVLARSGLCVEQRTHVCSIWDFVNFSDKSNRRVSKHGAHCNVLAHRSESDENPDVKPIFTPQQYSDEKSECKSESKSDAKSNKTTEWRAHESTNERTDNGAVGDTTVSDVHESVPILEQSGWTLFKSEG